MPSSFAARVRHASALAPRFLPLMLAVALTSACTRAGGPATPVPVAVPDSITPAGGRPALPPMPLATGPLAPRVQYPAEGALIASRDSNFIFGSVGNGRATLAINGHPVRVHPNGAFLAWIPVPSPDVATYELVAALGSDTARLLHPVRVLPARSQLGDSGRLVVDTTSVAPRGLLALSAAEPVRVSIRAPRNALAWVEGSVGRRRPLVPGADPYAHATDVPARWLADSLTLLVARDADTLRFPLARVDTLVATTLGWVMLGADSTGAPAADTDRVVYGRPVPGGTYRWFFLPGTIVRATGESAGFVRVRLDSLLDVWVARADVQSLGADHAAPRRTVPNVRVLSAPDWVDVVMPVGERPPFQVQALGNTLELTLYGTRANSDIIQVLANDSLVRLITWEQVSADRARYVLHLARPAFGWLAMWERGSFVLRVRRPPVVSEARPLAGLTIAIDAGHPPAGATGPTGLYEAIPVLDIARRVQRLLEQRGATVLMTRDTRDTLALGDRPIMARRANAHALVSIHLNALPDGVNPFTAQGTGSYYFWPPSEPMARAIQRGMVKWMGLPDLGVYYDNLALVRPTWMPSVLAEGAFIMIPEQEYAVSTPGFQERYARGVVEGLEEFFRALGAEGRR